MFSTNKEEKLKLFASHYQTAYNGDLSMRFIFTKGWSRLKEITAFYVNRRKRSKCLKFASKWVNLFSKSRFKQSVSHLQFLQCTFFAGSLISMIWCLFRANSTIFRYFAVNLHFCQSSSPLVYHLVNKKNNKFNAYEKRAYFFKFSRDVFFFTFFAALNFVHISTKLLLFTGTLI